MQIRRVGLVHDVDGLHMDLEIGTTSERIDLLKMWKRRWFVGVTAENDIGSVTQKIHRNRIECDKEK